MKKNLILIILLAVLMLFGGASCEGGSSESETGFANFNGGDNALSMEFASQAPPDKVRDQSLQPFSVRVLVENHGEADIEDGTGYVSLTGFDPAALGMNDTSKSLNMVRGYKKQGTNVIPGGIQQVVFDNLKYIETGVSGFNFKFYANICYPYETRAMAMFCINGDTVPSLDDRAKICDLEGDKEFSNSGAPVKIDNVKQYPYGESSIQIQFDIVHTPVSDQANVYESGSIDADCNINGNGAGSSEALFKRDRVTYTLTSGIDGLDCEGTGTNTNTVTLNDDSYTITCIQDTTGESEYEKPISFHLSYDYLDRINKNIQIEHVER